MTETASKHMAKRLTKEDRLPDVYLVDEPAWLSDLVSTSRGVYRGEENLYEACEAIQPAIREGKRIVRRINLEAATRLANGDRAFRREVIAHVHRRKKFDKK